MISTRTTKGNAGSFEHQEQRQESLLLCYHPTYPLKICATTGLLFSTHKSVNQPKQSVSAVERCCPCSPVYTYITAGSAPFFPKSGTHTHTHTHRLTSHAPVLYVVIASGRPQRLGAANKDRGPCQTWTNMANIFCLQSSGAELETTPKVWELGTSGPRHNRVLREEKKYSSLQNFCTEYLHLNIQSKIELRWLPIISILTTSKK